MAMIRKRSIKNLHFIIAVTMFLSSAIGYAQFRSERKQANIDVVERKRKKGGARKAGQNGRPRLSRSEIFVITAEKQLIRGIDKVLRSLRNTLKRLPRGTPQRLQIQERIHNLHLEQAAYVANQEHRRYDNAWEKWDASGRRGREPVLDDRKSKKHWSLVARSASALLTEFPKSPSADVVNLNQAMSLLFLGRDKSAARAFTRLIKKYPNSKVVGDAYFALGDYYFENNNFRNALRNYKSALRYRRSKRYGWALFKSGWAYYNISNYRKALEFWKKTVSYSRSAGAATGARLKDEALRDMVYAFAELKQIEPAITYFRVNGGQKYVGQFLTLLAQTFTDQGQYQSAIRVWKRLQRVAPQSEDAYTAQSEIVNLAYELGTFKTLWNELSGFPRRFGKGSAWASRQNQKFALEKHLEIRDQTIYYAKLVHKKAQKGNKRLLAHAKIGYKLFLRNFSQAKQVAEAKFNLADIEYSQKKFRESGNLYLQLTLSGPKKALIFDDKTGKPVESIHKTSAKYMLDAYYKDFEKQLKKLEKAKPNPTRPPRPLSIQARNFIKACGTYLKFYPKDKKLVQSCDVTVARTYYSFNHTKDAIDALYEVARKYPNTKAGPGAVDSLIPLLSKNKGKMVDVVTRLLSIPAYQKGKLGQRLRLVLENTAAGELTKIRDTRKRALAWANHAKKYPRSKEADKAWYNAAVDFLKAGMVAQAMGAYITIVNKYPKSAQVKESILQLAKINEKRMQFGNAAKYYLLYARRYPKAKESLAAIEKTCYLQIAVNPGSAIGPCSRLAAADKQSGIAAMEQLYDALFFAGDVSAMTSVIRNRMLGKLPLSPSQRIVAMYRLYAANGKRGPFGNQILQIFQRSPKQVAGEALRYVGEIVFKRNQGFFPKAMRAGLQGGTVEAMNGSIERKSQAITQLENAMGQVVSTQDPYWGVAAFYLAGAAYADLGKKLSNPPNINGAPPAEVKKQLTPLAKGALGKAAEFFGKAQEVARKHDVLSPYTSQLANAMINLRNPKLSFVEFVITPDFLGGEVPPQVSRKF